MKLTPIDIKQQQFRRRLRGVDASEVESFLELIGEQVQELASEIRELRAEGKRNERELEEHRSREGALREAMLTAQQAMDDVRDQAQKEAQLIVTEAELKAEKLLHNAHSRVGRILDEISDLRRQRARFIEEVRGVISVHGKLLEVHDDEAVRDAEDSEASVTVLDHVRNPSLPTAEEEEESDTSTAKGQR